MPEIDQRVRIAAHESGHATISRVLRLPSGAATIDGAPCAYLRDDHGLASLLTAMAGAAAEREQRMAEPSRKSSGCSVPTRPLSSPRVRRERGCPPWVVLGVKAVGARGVRAV
jgi:hypothetical protein